MGIKIPQNKFLIPDGAMDTVLQRWGLPPQDRSELLNLTEPELLDSVYKEYIVARSQVTYVDIFGANGLKLARTGHSVEEAVGVAIAVAKKAAAGTRALVALDVGPLGELLEPTGTLSFERARGLFREMAETGAEAGADLIVVETIADLYEVRATLLVAKEIAHLPVFVTMSLDANDRIFTGCTITSIARTLEGPSTDAIGLDCSLGPNLLAPLLKELCKDTRLSAIVKPSTSLPDPVDGHYDMGPEDFAQALLTYVEAGISVVSGCCGTPPEYIRRLTIVLEGKKPVP